jgi:branched-chain amino acid transport system ATP-binding protein
MASLWVIPGLIVLPIIGWISGHVGIRIGLLVLVPLFIIGSLVLGSAGSVIDADIAQVWRAAAARSEALYQRRHGQSDLLLVRGLNAGYDGRQVLFGVEIDIKEGEIVALLGTNGAGKSTLLKSISGVVEADRGAVILDGRDITHAPPNEIARMGISQMPGGQGVFGSLTVGENLRMSGWTREGRDADSAIEDVLNTFPVLRERHAAAAADLSGGQQQMLALGMAFVAKPRVLLIDELSLGLAPVIVGQLLPLVRRLADDGVAVVLVEQSVNIALTIAERAYFMERGMIRFAGPTSELLNRPDLLRSVFLTDIAAPGATLAATERSEQPALEVIGLERSFGGNHAVRNVSFSVEHREVVGMIGPNGAGKTTLFDLISGYVIADEGRVLLDGRDISADSPTVRARRGLGRSQDARLSPDMTVVEGPLSR